MRDPEALSISSFKQTKQGTTINDRGRIHLQVLANNIISAYLSYWDTMRSDTSAANDNLKGSLKLIDTWGQVQIQKTNF